MLKLILSVFLLPLLLGSGAGGVMPASSVGSGGTSARGGSSGAGGTSSKGGTSGTVIPSGTITQYTLPTALAGARAIAATSDGAVWVAGSGNTLARIASGKVFPYVACRLGCGPLGIVAGPDGNLWFTEYACGKIGRITASGAVTEYTLPAGAAPRGLMVGPDGQLWFVEDGIGAIGKIAP